jgi:alpha-ribazole phosphatase
VTLVECLRHGETEGGRRFCGSTDVALTPRGWQQMCAATDTRAWDLIIGSPLRRCAEFAIQLASRLAIPCRLDPDWREIHFGAWEGRTAPELLQTDADALGRFWADPVTHGPPGSEALQEFQRRVVGALQRAQAVVSPHAASGSTRVLVVTHAGPIRVLLAARSELPLSSLLSFEVPHAMLVTLDAPLPVLATHLERTAQTALPQRPGE